MPVPMPIVRTFFVEAEREHVQRLEATIWADALMAGHMSLNESLERWTKKRRQAANHRRNSMLAGQGDQCPVTGVIPWFVARMPLCELERQLSVVWDGVCYIPPYDSGYYDPRRHSQYLASTAASLHTMLQQNRDAFDPETYRRIYDYIEEIEARRKELRLRP